MNSRPELRNYKMRSIVRMTREILRMLSQYAVDYPTFPVKQHYFHLIVILEGCQAVLWECQAASMGRQVFWTRMVYRETFLQIHWRLLQHPTLLDKGSNPWVSNVSEHTSPHVMSERQTPDTTLDQRCQSGPSTRNSFDPCEGRFIKDSWADQQRLQISDLHFDKFPTPATFACWKIRFKTEVCTCSQFPTEAMQWIKEVELVDSVDELRPSSSTRGISMPNFEVVDARIASALNKITHNSHFKRRISLEEQKNPEAGPFPSRQTDCFHDLRLLSGHRSQ